MYSQNQEEAVITAYFTSNEGRLLDIGAHDGVKLSNSRKLLENGWTGVLVEPSPAVFTIIAEEEEATQILNVVAASIVQYKRKSAKV